MHPSLPRAGAVLGVDIGYSKRRRSSAACRLDWTADAVSWTITRYFAREPERTQRLTSLVDRPLLAAAFDGPLLPGFAAVDGHRDAERMLTRGLGRRIGKPGSSAVPVGIELNTATSTSAAIVRATGQVAAASHPEKIDAAAIVEAFPGAALGLMIAQPENLKVERCNRSDRYFEHLAETGGLDRQTAHLLPGRHLAAPFSAVKNHDERAALVCALTALGLAAGAHTAVGGGDGWIILPPRELMASWAWPALTANMEGGAGVLTDARAPVPARDTTSSVAEAFDATE